ncbi:hypothetical protein TNCV_4272541 [Trichonephila clavipes]|nr:hypothetical protein TNCV_4272541 [Trichonephila clavipes]
MAKGRGRHLNHMGCGSPMVKVSDYGRHVMSSILVPLKTLSVGERCTFNLSRAQTSSRWKARTDMEGGILSRPLFLQMREGALSLDMGALFSGTVITLVGNPVTWEHLIIDTDDTAVATPLFGGRGSRVV